jgi:hypothetical protein
MEKNKTGKYLKYAIGEIILVVIGIIIALSLNNWNDYQKTIANEQEILKSLEEEIKENIEQMEKLKSINNIYYNVTSEVISKLEQGKETYTTKEIGDCFHYTSSIVDSPVLDLIISSNSHILVKRKKLIKDFRVLKNKYSWISKDEMYLDNYWDSKITDFFISCGFLYRGYSESDPLISLADIEKGGYSKKQFIALLNMKKDLQDYNANNVKNAVDKSKEVLLFLKNEPK